MNATAWLPDPMDVLDDRSVTVRDAGPWGQADPTAPDHRLPDHGATAVQGRRCNPGRDFPGWLAAARASADPEAQLDRLVRWRDHAGVVRGALLHLARSLRAVDPDWAPRVFAIAAVAYLRAEAARPLLSALVAQARDDLSAQADLPSPEAWFALHAVDTLIRGAAFEAAGVFQSYLAQVEAIESAADPAAARDAAAARFIWRAEGVEASRGAAVRSRHTPAVQVPVASPVVAPVAPAPVLRPVPWHRRPAASATTAPAPTGPAPIPAAPPAAAPVAPLAAVIAPVNAWPRHHDEARVQTGLWLVGPAGPLPWQVPAAALICACGAVAAFVLGARLGGLFGPLAVLWIGGAIALFADRRWGWWAGLAALGLNAAYWVWVAGGALPVWLSPVALWLGAGVSLAGVGGLLMTPVRRRYRRLLLG